MAVNFANAIAVSEVVQFESHQGHCVGDCSILIEKDVINIDQAAWVNYSL